MADTTILSPMKRVSFGSSDEVRKQTYIYESASTSAPQPAETPNWKAAKNTQQRDEQLHREKVVTTETECPQAIQPPMSTAGESSSYSVHTSSQRTVMFSSPPLPSLQKADETVDNPFRPDGKLAHQVEPIVEAYKVRHGHDVTDSRNQTPVKTAPAETVRESTPSKIGSFFTKKRSSKDAATDGAIVRPSDIHIGQEVDVKRSTLASPKAGKVELVHVDDEETAVAASKKTKKCCSCSVQ